MTLLPFFAVLAVTLAWFLLPLIPALRELLRPTDTAPLSVVERDAANLAFFAERFRLWITAQLAGLPGEIPEGDYYGRLPSGTGFVRVRDLPDVLTRGPRPDGAHDRVIVTEAPVTLAGRETFLLEVYATAPWTGGPDTTLRALYGTGDVRLGPQSTVTRWIHADGILSVENDSLLFGRTSSGSAIRLGTGVRFERVGAPRIEVGTAPPSTASPSTRVVPDAAPSPWIVPDRARTVGNHLHVDGNTDLPPGVVHHGDLVVAGKLTIGAEARIHGSVKAHRGIQVGRGGVITGSLVSRTTIETAGKVTIGGPVIAEDEIILGEGTMVGQPSRETTVVAPLVTLGLGSVIFGQVSAGVSGTT